MDRSIQPPLRKSLEESCPQLSPRTSHPEKTLIIPRLQTKSACGSASVYPGYALSITRAINDVMCCRWWRLPLWALAFVSTLAPSRADGNIGCLFSSSLCIENLEWCYDDAAFGKCIPIFEDEPEDGSFYQYDMSGDQLQWFESELQQLVHRGYRWEHAYTQCVLQAMLYTLRKKLDVNHINTKLCDQFMDPKLVPLEGSETIDNNISISPDDTAYIKYMPDQTDFAEEFYSPPLIADDEVIQISPLSENAFIEGSNLPNDERIPELVVMKDEQLPVILPFGGFRERLQAESRTKIPKLGIDKQKKSLLETKESLDLPDEERLGAHYRKHKIKPIQPYTAEYITSNRFSPLDDRVKMIAQEKYKESFAAKNFPFEYENPDNEIPEPRIYFDHDDAMDSYGFDGGSGEMDPKDTSPENNIKNMQHLTQLWNYVSSKLKHQGPLYSEGGPLNADEVQGDSKISPEDLQLVYNALGFKRRERDDVKKPGPRLDANRLKFLYSKNVTEKLLKGHALQNQNPAENTPSGFAYDPSYAYVKFKNKYGTTWEKGIGFISKVEKLLGLEENTFTYPRVNITEVTFKVERNTKGFTAADVAAKLGNTTIKDALQQQTGAQILEAGIGDISKSHPISRHISFTDTLLFGLEMPVFLALAGSLAVLLVGGVVFIRLMQKDMSSKRKLQGLASAAEIDAEATRDYQDLCRARMYGGSGAANEPRVAALSKDSETKSPSARSSTSSWSEEPALTNMDISTGHMVLAYMEDHLRNKDRLDQEWRALCAYEAEPNATTAALKPENSGKNRYADVLPYDHSRVCLNTLTNHLGSDYINASTITDHDPRNPAYIAAAGPLSATAPDFWQMVWEQGSVVMVMLTRLTENGQQLCHRYWPEEGSQTYHIYEVHLVSEHIWCDDYLVRSFYLKNQRSGETRTVTQFHFLSWPERQVPSSAKALLEFRRKVNKSYRGRSCPIVVHCSDGAGRTGTYCLIDMVLNRMAKGAKEIDIAATLEHIRDQRPRTVATKQQFEFVLMAVAEEVHAILKALPAHLQQLQEKKEKDKEATDKDK